MHCIGLSNAKFLVFDDELFEAVTAIRGDLAALPKPPGTASYGVPVPEAHRSSLVRGRGRGRRASFFWCLLREVVVVLVVCLVVASSWADPWEHGWGPLVLCLGCAAPFP